jgi:hypothetical protein
MSARGHSGRIDTPAIVVSCPLRSQGRRDLRHRIQNSRRRSARDFDPRKRDSGDQAFSGAHALWTVRARRGRGLDIPAASSSRRCSLDVRFAPKATELLRCRKLTRCRRCSKIDYSITSSALASNVAGTVTPSDMAVFRFTLNTSLVDCSTGSSLGFTPFKMRST